MTTKLNAEGGRLLITQGHERHEMGDVVNFRKARKRIGRHLDEREAAANRLLHGRSKAKRKEEATRKEKTRRAVDQHQLETGDQR